MKYTEHNFWKALQFEATATAADIECHREKVLAQWKSWAEELEPARKTWLKTKVPKRLRKLMRNFHAPLFEKILQSIGYEDMAVVERMTTGFYFG